MRNKVNDTDFLQGTNLARAAHLCSKSRNRGISSSYSSG